ncbi:MAG TPA: hypothetical protein V6D47_19510 [Oscillatoriaceae cyanobacterium]
MSMAPAPQQHARDRRPLAIIAGIFGVLWILGLLLSPRDALAGYLGAYLFWLSLSLGSLAMLMLHHLVGGRWAAIARRPWEAAARQVPLLAVGALPIVLGMGLLFPWVHGHDPLYATKAGYLNVPFFVVRAMLYFVCWWGLAELLQRASDAQDANPDPALQMRMATISGPGIVVFGFTASFAAIDWIGGLVPNWYSTIFGMLMAASFITAGTAYATVALAVFRREPPYAAVLSWQPLNDLGNVLLACVMGWAYLAFSQYLIIWAGDISLEASFFVQRVRNGWSIFGSLLALTHFFAPFLLLLSREYKRSPVLLGWIGVLVLLGEAIHDWWLVVPSFEASPLYLPWASVLAFVGFGAAWLWGCHRALFARPLLPPHSPQLEGARHVG